ncbi:hypothetical protein H4R19_002077, partial [Coemansia spiralis]
MAMDRDTSAVELRDLAPGAGAGQADRRRRFELPAIDTSMRQRNLGGSLSMPPSPTGGLSPRRPALVTRVPSMPRTAGDLAALREAMGAPLYHGGHVQSGRMTKVPHYGRLRSVTARVLRLMDPRPSARQQQQHGDERGGAGPGAAGSGSAQAEDSSRGTAAGLLGLSVVDTVRDAGRRRLHRHSHGPDVLPTHLDALQRQASGESAMPLTPIGALRPSTDALRRSEDRTHRFSRRSSRSSSRSSIVVGGGLSTVHSVVTAEGGLPHAADPAVAIPLPGFFLDPASDYWNGGHSYRQRQRYPLEMITVPASLTKRVHYEVSYDYPKNAISTARYNVVTFLPAQVAAQFSKVANIYFLFIAALQQVPGWSTTGRWSTVLPLCVFVSLSIAHEGYDDLRRHRMDRAENTQRTQVLKVKVHDRDRVSFRHRGSHSIHSFRMRSSQSIHDMGRSTIDIARRWAISVATVGHTAKEAVLKHMADKRRKRRELEDSDDEDDHPLAAGTADPDTADGAESQPRRRLNRSVMSLRSWRGTVQGERQPLPVLLQPGADTGSGNASLAVSDVMSARDLRRPAVAFDEVVSEVSAAAADEQETENPLPGNMSCRWKRKRWENVQVGDLLRISKDDWIPADCIVLASTGFDGTCFVETAALDGETTLKQKQALEATNSAIQTAEQLAAFNAFTYVEPPSAELYSFEGYMEVGGERHPLTPNQLLLRGSVLRNTAYVFAQVVYAGEQTRLRRNATRNVRTKAPQIQRITNRIVVFVLLLLLALTFVFGGVGINWDRRIRPGYWYLRGIHVSASALVFGYIVMMNALIPISLYVTLEAVKIFQCWFIEQDVAMYHAPSNTRAEARTTAINEDLGMVRYVFSDKTGTLTENIMKLRAIMCAGFSYLHIDLDRLHDSAAPAPADDDASQLEQPATPPRSASRLSLLRSQPGSPTPGQQSPLPSPSLFRTQLFSRNHHHRRQQSLPSPSESPLIGSRATPAAAAIPGRPSPFGGRPSPPRHVRGASASVLRSPTAGCQQPLQGRSGLQNEVLPMYAQPTEPTAVASGPLAAVEDEPLLQPPVEEATASQLERAVAGGDEDDGDPDLIGPGEEGDPRAHTKAGDDAPVSDLQALPSTRRIMDGQIPSEVFRARAEWFLRCLALCHTVQPDRDPLTGRITGYQATSPDEKALVAAAAELGYVMNNRAGPLVQLRVVAQDRMGAFNSAVINGTGQPPASHGSPPPAAATAETPTNGQRSGSDNDSGSSSGSSPSAETDESFDRGVPAPHPTDRLGNYEVLDVLEFSSARKRMSVILRCPDGRIVMMAKGADSAIWQRLCAVSRLRSDPGDLSFMPRPSPPVRRPGAGPARHGPSRLDGVARLGDGRMYFGELGIGGRMRSSTGGVGMAGDDGPDGGEAVVAPMLSPRVRVLSNAPQHRRLMSESQFSTVSEASSFTDAMGRVEVPDAFATPTAEEEAWARARALEALHQFSTEGLRTLAYAHREIEPAYYEAWHARYVQASTALASRQQQVEAVCEEIERDLLLSGVSAIEDRLQEGVPETIFKLRRAGIRVWMLTGDKVETAINIAKSCRLVETDVVETTALDQAALDRHPGRMAMLVLQSYTDIDELDRVVSAALDVAQRMVTTVDQRFEARSIRARLRRGLKKFGNLLGARRGRAASVSPLSDDSAEKGDAQSPTMHKGDDDDDEWSEDVPTAPQTARGGGEPSTAGTADKGGFSARISDNERTMSLTTAVSQGATAGHEASRQASRQKQSRASAAATGRPAVEGSAGGTASLAVVVDGETLALLEAHAAQGLLAKFLLLGTLSDAVICSRVSPSQKALVVHEMRVRCEGADKQSLKQEAGRSRAYRWLVRPVRRLLVHDNDSFRV